MTNTLNNKIDFSDYNSAELVESLENINDLKYPESAAEIYTLLQAKYEHEIEPLLMQYQQDNHVDDVIEAVAALVLFPGVPSNRTRGPEMRDKLLRIQEVLTKQVA